MYWFKFSIRTSSSVPRYHFVILFLNKSKRKQNPKHQKKKIIFVFSTLSPAPFVSFCSAAFCEKNHRKVQFFCFYFSLSSQILKEKKLNASCIILSSKKSLLFVHFHILLCLKKKFTPTTTYTQSNEEQQQVHKFEKMKKKKKHSTKTKNKKNQNKNKKISLHFDHIFPQSAEPPQTHKFWPLLTLFATLSLHGKTAKYDSTQKKISPRKIFRNFENR